MTTPHQKKPSSYKPETRLPIFDTMQQCAAVTGIPVTTQKQAKRAGADAFKHGRIDLQKLLRWLFSQERSTVDWGDEYKKWRSKREQAKHEEEAGKLIPVDWLMDRDTKILTRVDQILEQKLCNEYPSAVAGLDVPQARVYGKRLGDQIREEFNKLKEHRKR